MDSWCGCSTLTGVVLDLSGRHAWVMSDELRCTSEHTVTGQSDHVRELYAESPGSPLVLDPLARGLWRLRHEGGKRLPVRLHTRPSA